MRRNIGYIARTSLAFGMLALASGAAASAQPLGHGAGSHPKMSMARRAQSLDGRVVAVRRLTREVTIQTQTGSLHRVSIPRDAKVHARGMAGMDAVRSGSTIHLDTVRDPNGKLVARAAAVR